MIYTSIIRIPEADYKRVLALLALDEFGGKRLNSKVYPYPSRNDKIHIACAAFPDDVTITLDIISDKNSYHLKANAKQNGFPMRCCEPELKSGDEPCISVEAVSTEVHNYFLQVEPVPGNNLTLTVEGPLVNYEVLWEGAEAAAPKFDDETLASMLAEAAIKNCGNNIETLGQWLGNVKFLHLRRASWCGELLSTVLYDGRHTAFIAILAMDAVLERLQWTSYRNYQLKMAEPHIQPLEDAT